jgi:hypothetical protein
MPSKTLLGRPPGLASVYSISGGTELISTAFGDPALAEPGDAAQDLPDAGGVPDVHRVAQVQVLGHHGQVIGVVVHVMTTADLRRTPVTSGSPDIDS